jgi:hypothetical protein
MIKSKKTIEEMFPGFDGSCSICKGPIDHHKTLEGEVFWIYGHNAQPVNDGRCCSDCNSTVVIPVRIKRMRL